MATKEITYQIWYWTHLNGWLVTPIVLSTLCTERVVKSTVYNFSLDDKEVYTKNLMQCDLSNKTTRVLLKYTYLAIYMAQSLQSLHFIHRHETPNPALRDRLIQ